MASRATAAVPTARRPGESDGGGGHGRAAPRRGGEHDGGEGERRQQPGERARSQSRDDEGGRRHQGQAGGKDRGGAQEQQAGRGIGGGPAHLVGGIDVGPVGEGHPDHRDQRRDEQEEGQPARPAVGDRQGDEAECAGEAEQPRGPQRRGGCDEQRVGVGHPRANQATLHRRLPRLLHPRPDPVPDEVQRPRGDVLGDPCPAVGAVQQVLLDRRAVHRAGVPGDVAGQRGVVGVPGGGHVSPPVRSRRRCALARRSRVFTVFSGMPSRRPASRVVRPSRTVAWTTARISGDSRSSAARGRRTRPRAGPCPPRWVPGCGQP